MPSKCYNNTFLPPNNTHLVLFILEGDLKVLSCTDHGLHRGEDVLVDQFGEALLVFICIAWAMDYSHLLDESALSTFSSTWKIDGSSKQTAESNCYEWTNWCKRYLSVCRMCSRNKSYSSIIIFLQTFNKRRRKKKEKTDSNEIVVNLHKLKSRGSNHSNKYKYQP